jgi:hypothetical protein
MSQLTAVITKQGNVFSRRAYDPSGFQISTPHFFPKTFRTLNAAVLFGVKKGYKVVLPKPLTPSGQAALLEVQFETALEQAALTLAAEAAAEQEE